MSRAVATLAVVALAAAAPARAGAPLAADAARDAGVAIPAGRFAPLFGLEPGQADVAVAAFRVDRHPVTVRQFAGFLGRRPEWRPGRVGSLYADAAYLRGWRKDGRPGSRAAEAPVVHVSWFAASAYCEDRGGRLPTVLEWEYVGAASELKADASRDPRFAERVLEWYSRPSGDAAASPVLAGNPNYYGVHDLHGLVWEWTEDFNSVFVSGDNRQDGDKSAAMVCGSGSVGASSRENYAAFMRYAMRSSLSASFAQPNLGFRCAYPARKESKG